MSGFKRRSNPAALTEKLTALTGSKDFSDASEWKLSTDKSGNGSAVIRFLPAKSDDDTPFVKIHSHGFKVNGRWLIENCPTTIGRDDCPVCKSNSELWATEIEANQKIVRERKRKLSYWANIVVIKDESKPDNEGKVFKYRFGQKIMDKIVAQAAPDADLGTEGMDVTCVFDGANFLLKSKKVSGFLNYDDSKFGNATELFGGDEDKLGEVWEQMHDLNKIIAPSEFKTEAELQAKLTQVTGQKAAVKNGADDALSDLDDVPAQKASKPDPIDTASNADADLDALLSDLDLDAD